MTGTEGDADAGTTGEVVFTTPRLVARRWVPSDADAAHEIYRHEAVTRWLGAEPHADLAATGAALQRRIDAYDRRPGLGSWAVVERAMGRVVGCVQVAPLADTGEIEVGYEFAPASWGQGYATEIARAALSHAWETAGLRQVIAIVYPDNAASRRVIEKIGMVRDGTLTLGRDTFDCYVAVTPADREPDTVR
jgi:[ribosomal protein S5]-alanine N-acetyltransferase